MSLTPEAIARQYRKAPIIALDIITHIVRHRECLEMAMEQISSGAPFDAKMADRISILVETYLQHVDEPLIDAKMAIQSIHDHKPLPIGWNVSDDYVQELDEELGNPLVPFNDEPTKEELAATLM